MELCKNPMVKYPIDKYYYMEKLIICFCFFSVLSSCYTGKLSDKEKLRIAEEGDKVEKCRENWVYSNLTDTLTVKVLFSSGGDCPRENALLFGVTKHMDTIALYNWNYDGPVLRNDIVDIVPQPMVKRVPPAPLTKESTMQDTLDFYVFYNGEESHKGNKPGFFYSKESSINDIFCRVTKIQAGNIKAGSLRKTWEPKKSKK